MIINKYSSDNSNFGTIITTLGNEIGKDGKPADQELLGNSIPDVLPILPVRGIVVYPLTAVPLTVGQPRSVNLIDDVSNNDRIIGLVTSKNPDIETPGPDELYRIGTAAAVHRLMKTPDGTIRLLVQGIARISIGDYIDTKPYLKAQVELHPETREKGIKLEALVRTTVKQFENLAHLVPSIPEEMIPTALNIDDPRQLAYAIATYLRIDLKLAQKLLEQDRVSSKLKQLLTVLGREIEVLELGHKLQKDAHTEMEGMQREYFLREQLKAIQRELGEGDEATLEVDEFRSKISAAGMPDEAHKEATRELERLSKLPTASAEYGVIRTYLDCITSLPWTNVTTDNLDLKHAQTVLNEDHYGLMPIKERILEFLAVRKLRLDRRPSRPVKSIDQIRHEREGVILCLVGPPGVGKTSLGKSIARAMGRKFIRMSLGGMRDEAEIRGHRRTYIGAMPGRIIQSIRRSGSKNPVFMLDEVDKLGVDFRGDPASALLELLDPEQNRAFRDHYLDVDFDLSQVFFITTANMLEPIPPPLRDRMEILQMSGYTETEKLNIARDYLVPRQVYEHGLRKTEIRFKSDALIDIARYYTREAGVRNLERNIGQVCRKVATHIASNKFKQITINLKRVNEFLGKPQYFFSEEIAQRTAIPGVATAIAWTPFGGDVLFVEATKMPGEKGFRLTGQLGEVMQESAQAALSYIKANSDALGLSSNHYQNHDIHLHVPSGSVPKDGPSAGVTMATALASLFSHKPVKPDVGMTGEITLRGQVLPVGGIKEKVLAAHRAGLTTVVLPRRNEKDLDDVPKETRKKLKFVLVDRVEEVFAEALVAKSKSVDNLQIKH
ncbi:MAG: endopeptidase La [Chloroflexi bacterium]|nr:endopeptidase La [Chloroflexota bacterium]|tara:strand:+ start:409 stop:2919 length:2511 start_codon:yes stop_codon:yes gene_type:complete